MSQQKCKSITFLSRHAPYGTENARTCLDLVLACSAFEQDINYIFTGNGVYQLLKNQQSKGLGQKNFGAALAALEAYGIDKVFVNEDSLLERDLTPRQLAINVVLIDEIQMQGLVRDADIVFNL